MYMGSPDGVIPCSASIAARSSAVLSSVPTLISQAGRQRYALEIKLCCGCTGGVPLQLHAISVVVDERRRLQPQAIYSWIS